MIQLLTNMGYILWPMLAAAMFLLVQIGKSALHARRAGAEASRTRHAILVWGFLNALLGVLGTVLGLAVTAQSVAHAGSAEPALVGMGLQIALSPSIFGLLLLTFAVIAWLILQTLQTRPRSS